MSPLTSGKRKGPKVFGLIDYRSGRLFWKGQTARFNGEISQQFLVEVLSQTQQPSLLIQNGAREHTGQVLQQFFAAPADRLTVFQLPCGTLPRRRARSPHSWAATAHRSMRWQANSAPKLYLSFERIDAAQRGGGGQSVPEWGRPGDGCYLEIKPLTALTYRR
ncbi:MAG: hypothetical protein ACR2PL_25000 [Dehalococcoidia bacterium]